MKSIKTNDLPVNSLVTIHQKHHLATEDTHFTREIETFILHYITHLLFYSFYIDDVDDDDAC